MSANTKKIVRIGLLTAISIVLLYALRPLHVSIFAATPFLKYDAAFVTVFFACLAFGALDGVLLTLLICVLQIFLFPSSSGLYGPLMDFLAGASFALAAGLAFHAIKKDWAALLIGIISSVVVMGFANLLITPAFMGVPTSAVIKLMGFILAFNLIKAGINSVIAFVAFRLLKRILTI
ncbi:MAG: ECF transporter S component [Clostridiales bacterium]|jgi:riboflavin transporter FmnP|nr:ECF transporter S component [Clostridiales bacterium]